MSDDVYDRLGVHDMTRLRFIIGLLRARLAQWPTLTALGLFGIGLAAICGTMMLIRGPEIPPEGNLIDTGSFNSSVGFFTLTLAVLASGVMWTRRERQVWIGVVVAVTLYAFAIETIQAFRGLDPRFSRVAGPVDQIAGVVFGVAAIILAICFTVLAIKYFRAIATPVVLAVRYGAVAAWVAFAVGIAMSVVQGRHVAEHGNLLFVHAAGFHGLQFIPAVALLHQWASNDPWTTRRFVHVAGIAWLGACLGLAWQSGSGHAISDVTPAGMFVTFCLLVFAVVLMIAAWTWARATAPITA